MFFQVDDLHQIKFKEHYFDLVVSDSALHRFENPSDVLNEINRVTKPTAGNPHPRSSAAEPARSNPAPGSIRDTLPRSIASVV